VLWNGGEGRALRDVVRFDSAVQCWTAVVDERPIRTELPPASIAAVRARYLEVITAAAAADGTLRLGVDAVAALDSPLR
jgi:hypothetical protein